MNEKDRIAAAEEMKNREIRKISDLQIFESATNLGEKAVASISNLLPLDGSDSCAAFSNKLDSLSLSMGVKLKFVQLCSEESRLNLSAIETEAIEAFEHSAELGEDIGPILQESNRNFLFFSPAEIALDCYDCDNETGPSGIWIVGFDQKTAIQNIK